MTAGRPALADSWCLTPTGPHAGFLVRWLNSSGVCSPRTQSSHEGFLLDGTIQTLKSKSLLYSVSWRRFGCPNDCKGMSISCTSPAEARRACSKAGTPSAGTRTSVRYAHDKLSICQFKNGPGYSLVCTESEKTGSCLAVGRPG